MDTTTDTATVITPGTHELTDHGYQVADDIEAAMEAHAARRTAAGKDPEPWLTPSRIARLARHPYHQVRDVLEWLSAPRRLMTVISDGASYGIRRYRLK